MSSREGRAHFKKGFSFFLSAEISPATAGGIEDWNLPWLGKQASGPTDDFDLIHMLEDREKIPATGELRGIFVRARIALKPLDKMSREKQPGINIVIIRFTRSAHLGS